MTPLTPLRMLTGTEPVIIAPPGSALWPTLRRLQRCEIYGLPEGGDCRALMTPFAWFAFRQRDVCFWPVDCWSSHAMTLIVAALTRHEPPNGPMAVVRWAWGHPAADELGELQATIETVWKRNAQRAQQAA